MTTHRLVEELEPGEVRRPPRVRVDRRVEGARVGLLAVLAVARGVALDGRELFFSRCPPARRSRPGPPVPAAPGKVFDLELPLNQAAEAYWAMDERRAIKALLRV